MGGGEAIAETFLILLAGGIMLAAAVSDPQQVTLLWLRLCGILALAMAGLSAFFLLREAHPGRDMIAFTCAATLAILAQLAFAQLAWRRTQQWLSFLAFFFAVAAGYQFLKPTGWQRMSAWRGLVGPYAACIGIAAMCGLTLMDMLLGHAYLTASRMTMAPFLRLNSFLAGTLLWRAILAGIATAAMSREIWLRDGLFILTRWLVGLAVPAVFIYMAHDCIKRRATQSATGILYVAGVLIFIGELIALHLVRSSGLPF
jgi:hypothetical protein